LSRIELVEEALRRFTLVAGSAGDPDKGTACPVSALSWVAREEWSDHPECAHPLICDIVIDTADDPSTTPEEREALVRAGVTGLLDTADVPTEVVLAAISGSRILHGLAGQPETLVPTALCVLEGVTAWKRGHRGDTGPLFFAGMSWESACFSHLDLSGADLRRTDFCDAYLVGTDFTRADMYDTNVSGADMRESNLSEVDLSLALVSNASLAGARLSGARFVDADLTAADLRGAVIDGDTDFTGADLTAALWSGIDPPPGWEARDGRLYPL
jgi:hypothetical protein